MSALLLLSVLANVGLTAVVLFLILKLEERLSSAQARPPSVQKPEPRDERPDVILRTLAAMRGDIGSIKTEALDRIMKDLTVAKAEVARSKEKPVKVPRERKGKDLLRQRLGLVVVMLLLPVLASAQAFVRLATAGTSDELSASDDSFTIAVGGMATARIQTLDTYTGTWQVLCSTNTGTTFDADHPVPLLLVGTTTEVSSVSDTVGAWTVNVAGCTHIKIAASAGFAASDVTVSVQAIAVGGGAAVGGGGGGNGAVVDGVDNGVAATVFDYNDSNPLAVVPVASDGTAVAPASGNTGAPDAGTVRMVPASLPLPYRSIDLDESEEEADDSASELCGVWYSNTAATIMWLKIYNADADDVTVATTVPEITIALRATTTDMLVIPGGCVQFSVGITIAATTEQGDDGSAAGPGANEVTVAIFRR